MRLVTLALLLAACRVDAPSTDTGGTDTGDTASDTDTNTDTAADPDADGDGSPDGEDCDDTNPAVFPGAPEVCNGADDDCDGSVDELATDMGRWYDDDDGDGYGVELIQACEQPEGSSTVGGDCDDGNAAINPGALEVCDELDVDEDCDGAADDADAGGADGAREHYLDADADGFGDAATSVLACDPPEGYVASPDDCDDAAADVYPGAPEICGDTLDQDCDGADLVCEV